MKMLKVSCERVLLWGRLKGLRTMSVLVGFDLSIGHREVFT
jgi:hypothetical protein